MRILITGASGFIASQFVTDLNAAGHTVIGCVRNTAHAKNIFPNNQILACNFLQDTSSTVWEERLQNIDVVINCVGILYHPKKEILWDVHYATPRALFDAAVKMGVKKIIQISALGVDHADVEYAKSKKAADDYLLSLPIQAIILRPSLVYGSGSYGGTSLFRGLASMPWVLPVPGKGDQQFQPVHLQDLSKAIVELVQDTRDQSIILNAVGPKRINLREILMKTRSWLGIMKAKIIPIPLTFIRLGAWFGSFIPYSAMNTTSYKMLIQNNITSENEAKKFHDYIGFIPRDFIAGIDSHPSTVQDRWHAQLFFLKPLLQLSIAFVWIFTAICSLFSKSALYALLNQIGIDAFWQPILLYGACLLNAALGFAFLVGYQLKKVGILQIMTMLFYTAIITWKLPYLWLDPFAPIAKNIPLLVATLIFLSIKDDR